MTGAEKRKVVGVVGFTFQTILSLFVIAAAVVLIGKGMAAGYAFGYSVFNETPVAGSGEGVVMEVTVDAGENIFDIAQELEDLGLIRDAKIMIVQKYLFQYTIYPGTYSLSTSMPAKDMLERIGTAPEKQEEEE